MFDDIRLPEDIEKDAKGGPTFSTTIVKYGNGREKRNANWSRQLAAYDISYGIQTKDDYAAVLSFFYARLGRAVGFRFKDWSDYRTFGEAIGTGDGTTVAFQLFRTYPDTLRPFRRKITRAVVGTVVPYINGAPQTGGFSLAGGIVTFNAPPAAGAILTADFEFDVPVRFDTDALDMDMNFDEVVTISSIKLMEITE